MSAAFDEQTGAKPTTAEDLVILERGQHRYELVAGTLERMPLHGFLHGAYVHRLSSFLSIPACRNAMGLVLGAGTGFILRRNPDTVRCPDVSFVSRERVDRIGIPKGYFPEAPDLAVEVASPNDRVAEVEAKAEDLLNGGTRLLWVISPRSRTVTVYQSLSNIVVLTEGDLLDGGAVVPGFSHPVSDLFQPFFSGNPPN